MNKFFDSRSSSILRGDIAAERALDSVMLDPQRVGGTVADAWGNWLRKPRWLFLTAPTEGVRGVLILSREIDDSIKPTQFLMQSLEDLVSPRFRVLAVSSLDGSISNWVPKTSLNFVKATKRVLTEHSSTLLWNWLVRNGRFEISMDTEQFQLSGRLFGDVIKRFFDSMVYYIEQAEVSGGITSREAFALYKMCYSRERALMRHARALFLQMLNRTVIQYVSKRATAPSICLYNLFASAPDNVTLQYRRQALRAFPNLLVHFVNGEAARSDDKRELIKCIDEGAPLIPWLAEYFFVRKEVISRLRGLPYSWLHMPNIATGIRWLAYVPPEHRPTQKEEWRAFTILVLSVDELGWKIRANELGVDFPSEWGDAQAGEFLARAGRQGWTTYLQKFSDGFVYTQGLIDFSAVLDSIVRICEFRKIDLRPVLEALAKLKIEKVQQISESWHKEIGRAQHVLEGGVDWPPLIEPCEVDGVMVTPLTTPEMLLEESRRLQHCASTYTAKCRHSTVHILSLRDRSGESLSTLEIRLEPRFGQFTPVMIQHRGMKNQPPPASVVHVWKVLSGWLSRPSMQDRYAELELARQSRVQDCRKQRLERGQAIPAFEITALEGALPEGIVRMLA
jgi:hypothetical protein